MNEWPLSQFAVRSSTLHKDAREIEVAESKGVSAGRFFFLEYSPLAGSADRSESADPARIVRGRNAAGVVHLKTQVFSIAELVDKESDFELAVVDAFASTGNAIQLPPRVLFGSLFDDKSPSFAVDLPEESAFDAIQVCRDSATGLIRCLVWSKLEDRKSGGEPLTVSKGVNGPVGRYLQQELICASLELPVVLSQRIFWENGDLSLSRQLQSSPPFSGSLTVDKWLLSRPSIVSIEMLQSKKSDSQEPSVRTLKRFDVSVGVHSNAQIPAFDLSMLKLPPGAIGRSFVAPLASSQAPPKEMVVGQYGGLEIVASHGEDYEKLKQSMKSKEGELVAAAVLSGRHRVAYTLLGLGIVLALASVAWRAFSPRRKVVEPNR